MREGFVFYKSFLEAMSFVPDMTDRWELLKAICEYATEQKDPQLNGYVMGIFVSIKPQIDANNRRYENGKKGGAPAGNSNATKKEKQPKTTKNNQKQPKDKDKDKEKEKVKDNVKEKANVKANVNVNDFFITPEGASIHDDISKNGIVLHTDHEKMKYQEWENRYGEQRLCDIISRLPENRKSFLGLMLELEKAGEKRRTIK